MNDDVDKLRCQVSELRGTVESLVRTVNLLIKDRPELEIKPTKPR